MTDGDYEGESHFFTDDVKMVTDLLNKNWHAEFGVVKPTISYDKEGVMADSRYGKGYIFVYQVSRYNSVASTDYGTLNRNSFVSVRISTRSREVMYAYMDEVYRILYDYRRAGMYRLNGYTHMEITSDNIERGEIGWYTASIDLKFTAYCYRIKSPGFGRPDEDWVKEVDNQ